MRLEPCDSDSPFVNNPMQLKGMMCIRKNDYDDLVVQGNFYTPEFRYIQLNFIPCNDTLRECQDTREWFQTNGANNLVF